MSPADLKKGAIFLGQYRVDRLLGRGGIGEVWQAYDFQLKRAVAIKVTLRDVAAEPGYAERFERETQVVAQFKHPNICRGTPPGRSRTTSRSQLYMVMEAVEGQSLALMLRIVKRFDETSACYYASQLLEALHEAHEKKSSTVTSSPRTYIVGQGRHVTVIDFGIAKARGTSREVGGTRKGRAAPRATLRIGTPRYMSPEQMEGRESTAVAISMRSGFLLYLMLSGDFAYPDPRRRGRDGDPDGAPRSGAGPAPDGGAGSSRRSWARSCSGCSRRTRTSATRAPRKRRSICRRTCAAGSIPSTRWRGRWRPTGGRIAHKAVYDHSQRPTPQKAAAG